jgi:hypothetical protein
MSTTRILRHSRQVVKGNTLQSQSARFVFAVGLPTWVPHVFVSPVTMVAIELLIEREIRDRAGERGAAA